jgi:RHS repeat-associated protein
MSRKTRPEKRSSARRSAVRSTSRWFSRLDTRGKIIGCIIIGGLIAGVTYARLAATRSTETANVQAVTASKSDATNLVKEVSTLSADELAAIPPEALHPRPAGPAGWNASRGGLPPGALPPGVVLPGITDSGRTTAQGYGLNDGVRQQFTGQERDTESGLDYFHSRYYSSAQGRFTSPDEFKGGSQEVNVLGKGDPVKQALPYADITNPQSLNKYAYAYNNPLRYVDKDGHCPVCIVVAVIAIAMSAEYVNAPGPGDPIYRSGTGQRDLVNNIFIGEMTAGAFRAAPMVARMAFGRLTAAEAVGAVESRIIANAAQGARFESRVLGILGETKNTARIMQGEATGAAYRVPDILSQKITNVVGEIKSTTGTLRATNQFKDLLSYSQNNNAVLKFYLTPEAKLTKDLITRLVKANAEVYEVVGDKIVRRNLQQ